MGAEAGSHVSERSLVTVQPVPTDFFSMHDPAHDGTFRSGPMNGLRARLHDRFHEARAQLFVDLLEPWPGARLLDLGGGGGALARRITRRVPLAVTVADIAQATRDEAIRLGFTHVLLSPDADLPFRPGEFDYLLCNSVIEHVTLPKAQCAVTARVPQDVWKREARAAQKSFAQRIRTLAPSYFVQTPHKHFPIDPHVLLPFVQYLPHNHVCRLVRWTDQYWIKTCLGCVDWELLTPAVIGELFPDANVLVERFAGLPKSVVAWKRSVS